VSLTTVLQATATISRVSTYTTSVPYFYNYRRNDLGDHKVSKQIHTQTISTTFTDPSLTLTVTTPAAYKRRQQSPQKERRNIAIPPYTNKAEAGVISTAYSYLSIPAPTVTSKITSILIFTSPVTCTVKKSTTATVTDHFTTTNDYTSTTIYATSKTMTTEIDSTTLSSFSTEYDTVTDIESLTSTLTQTSVILDVVTTTTPVYILKTAIQFNDQVLTTTITTTATSSIRGATLYATPPNGTQLLPSYLSPH